MAQDSSSNTPPPADAGGDGPRDTAGRYQELFAQAQDVIYVLDGAGNVIDLNAAGEQVTGYRREELLGRPIARLVLPEYLPAMLQMLERKIDGQPFTTYEVEILSRDGRRVALEVSTRLIYRGGRPVEIHGIARDITRRRQARAQQEFLNDVSQVLASTLDDDAVLGQIAALAVPRVADYCLVDIVEPDGQVRRAAALHADPAMAATLAELAERYPPRPLPLTGVPAVLREGGTLFNPSVAPGDLERAAQDARHLELLHTLNPQSAILVPIRLAGQVSGVITLALTAEGRRYTEDDVALAEELALRAAQALTNARLYRAARQARAEAEAAVRLRDTFLSVAAHELKTPMTALLGQAQLLQRRAEREGTLSARDRRSVDVIAAQARRLNRLTLALLDASRIQQGRLTIERAPLDMAELVGRVAEEVEPMLSAHELRVERPAAPLVVLGDALRLEQVVLNLLENAVKYSPAGGPVELQLEREGGMARLRVTDAGIGVPAAALPQLFTRFFRAENAAGGHISGMGIGLSVVHEIVGLHGGRVEAASEEGRGSCFTVWLPLAE